MSFDGEDDEIIYGFTIQQILSHIKQMSLNTLLILFTKVGTLLVYLSNVMVEINDFVTDVLWNVKYSTNNNYSVR